MEGFFYLTAESTRNYVLALANFTGWSLAEIEQMDIDDLAEWLKLLPKNHG